MKVETKLQFRNRTHTNEQHPTPIFIGAYASINRQKLHSLVTNGGDKIYPDAWRNMVTVIASNTLQIYASKRRNKLTFLTDYISD